VTILPQLEQDLFNAAEERLRPDATAPNRRPGSPASSLRPRLGRGAGALPVVLSVAVAIAVAFVAVAVLGHGHRANQGTTASGPSGGSSRAELIRTLGVLRRPQTKADLQGLERLDREVRALKARPHLGPFFTQWGYHQLDRRLARVVNVHLPARGAKVLIAPIRSEPSPRSGQRLESVHIVTWWTGNVFTSPMSSILDDGPGHNGDAPTSVGALLAHGLGGGNVVPGLTNPMDGTVRGPDVQDSVLLVPDGVASVRLGRFTLWPGELTGFSTKALNAALATLQRTATVHDNIAAFQLAIPVLNGGPWTGPRPAPRSYLNAFGANVQNTWFDASGHVIKRTTTAIGVTLRFEVAHAAKH
jgi:hypothetical protein